MPKNNDANQIRYNDSSKKPSRGRSDLKEPQPHYSEHIELAKKLSVCGNRVPFSACVKYGLKEVGGQATRGEQVRNR